MFDLYLFLFKHKYNKVLLARNKYILFLLLHSLTLWLSSVFHLLKAVHTQNRQMLVVQTDTLGSRPFIFNQMYVTCMCPKVYHEIYEFFSTQNVT